MKKALPCLTLLLFFMVLILPINVYALSDLKLNTLVSDDELAEVPIVITSGINTAKESESTFDSVRTIVGEAPKGTNVNISVSIKLDDNKTKETANYEITVGNLGVFSQATNLSVGENLIEIKATLENHKPVSKVYSVKRKAKEIKLTLEKIIVLPSVGS